MNSDNNPTPADSESTITDSRKSHVGSKGWLRRSLNPFRIATLRGLGVLLPPLLTIIFFFWAWNTVERAVLRPVEASARYVIVWSIGDIRDDSTIQQEMEENPGRRQISNGIEYFVQQDGDRFRQIGNQWIPDDVYKYVAESNLDKPPESAKDYYHQYVRLKHLKRHLVIPAFLAAFIAFLYLTGKLIAAGVGRMLWRTFEGLINRVPIIRNVYSSVKQVTDFAFNETEIQFSRVVAVEYPRKGIWSMGFVTGESLAEIRNAAGEPMLNVLMPTSPMPATGFTIAIPKSETIDLDMTIDQAIQFCVSCGVVVPGNQQAKSTIDGEVRRRFNQQIGQEPAIEVQEIPPNDNE